VLTGLAQLGTYHITLQDSFQPVINPSRQIPHSLKDRLRQALDRNVSSGVLKKVDHLTDWVSNLVVVEGKMGHYDYVWTLKILRKQSSVNTTKFPPCKKFQQNLPEKLFSPLLIYKMDTGKYNWMKKVPCCVLSVHHLAATVSPGCLLALNQQARSSRKRTKRDPRHTYSSR